MRGPCPRTAERVRERAPTGAVDEMARGTRKVVLGCGDSLLKYARPGGWPTRDQKSRTKQGRTVAASATSSGKTSIKTIATEIAGTKGEPVYQRLVLKLSGESLAGPQESGIHAETIQGISHEVKEICDLGVQVAIVVGGGNFFRGTRQKELAIDRATGDYMGMLATVINGLAMLDALEKAGCHTRLLSAIEMHQVAEPFIRRRATRHLEKGRVVIFAAGTGNPYFSTDTAAALRAMEIKAQVILKATRVDGVYDADPEKVKGAKKFENDHLPGRAAKGTDGDGLDGHFVVHGQPNADRGVQYECSGESEARGAGRAGRLVVTMSVRYKLRRRIFR